MLSLIRHMLYSKLKLKLTWTDWCLKVTAFCVKATPRQQHLSHNVCYEKRWGRIAVPCRFKVKCLSVCRQVWGVRLRGSAEHGPDQLHHQAADRAGKGVPLQQVSDPCAPRWDRGCAAAEWDSGENLVPEPEDEAEKEGERRAGASQGSIPWLWREDSRKNGRCRIREVNLSTLYSVPTIIHSVFHRGWALLLQLRTYCLFTP